MFRFEEKCDVHILNDNVFLNERMIGKVKHLEKFIDLYFCEDIQREAELVFDYCDSEEELEYDY